MFNDVFIQISLLLGLTVSVAFIVRLLRQPLMIAYLIAGIVAGPFFLNLLGGNIHLFDQMADFGVVLLLFVVGLSLNFEHIKKIGKVSLITGAVQLLFTSSVGYLILRSLEFSWKSALYLAIAISFSSTIIIVKLLSDKQDTEAVYGRYTLGLMIVQDIVVVLVMMIMTSITGEVSVPEMASSLIIKTLLLISFITLTARYIIPYILRRIADSSEFLFIFTLAWCFGIASLLNWLGFSIEIGGIIAGLTLGSSVYQREISSRVKPLRDFFIVLFFIILGSELSLANLNQVVIPGLIISAFILLVKPFLLYHTFRLQKFTRRNSFLSALTSAQVSEFGFVLLLTAIKLGHINGSELELFTFTALVTIILSSYAISYNEELYRAIMPALKWFGSDKHTPEKETRKEFDVWVFGYHRIGWKICDALEEKGIDYAVVDFNPEAIEKLEERNIPAFFGDAADVEFLESLPLEKSKMIISTLPEVDDQETLISFVRKRNNSLKIIANLHHIRNLNNLYEAGANYVMLPHLLGGSFIAEQIKNKPWSKETFQELREIQKKDLELKFTSPEEVEQNIEKDQLKKEVENSEN